MQAMPRRAEQKCAAWGPDEVPFLRRNPGVSRGALWRRDPTLKEKKEKEEKNKTAPKKKS